MEIESYEIESCVRGYHIYKETWTPLVGEEYECRIEPDNSEDPYAVAIVAAGSTVGHVPRVMSAAFSLFLRREGQIVCTITGSRRYSHDLPQGGLELPCTYKLSGENKLVSKVQNFFAIVLMLRTLS